MKTNPKPSPAVRMLEDARYYYPVSNCIKITSDGKRFNGDMYCRYLDRGCTDAPLYTREEAEHEAKTAGKRAIFCIARKVQFADGENHASCVIIGYHGTVTETLTGTFVKEVIVSVKINDPHAPTVEAAVEAAVDLWVQPFADADKERKAAHK